ncbi:MAG TPA: TonB family protein [Fibrobacteria bacterium]|nr:TonB family protein [Fibrobacteria bacterium]HOX50164.1 TonB family protein [Fibrobacteria bacterium]
MSKRRFLQAAALLALSICGLCACKHPISVGSAASAQPTDDNQCPPEGPLAWKLDPPIVGTDTIQDLFPLQSIDVTTRVSGPVAHVKVHQVFGNGNKVPVEAVYLFPLPHKAAVRDMAIRTKDRVVRAVIQRRADARRTYEDASRRGQQASLLEQERDDVFTQSVANLMPGDTIGVDIELVVPLVHADGWTEFAFPTVVGPRFCPPGKVPDMGRIGAPRLPSGMAPPQKLTMNVTVDAGFPLQALESPTHCLRTEGKRDPESIWHGPVSVSLKPGGVPPTRDFVLRWKTRQDQSSATVLADGEEQNGHFLVELQPPAIPGDDNSTAKELVFLVDQSGSMGGAPLDLVKKAMRTSLEHMEPRDRFQIVGFSSTAQFFAKAPVPATKANIKEGIAWVDALDANGGTMMLEGLQAAFAVPVDKKSLRIIAMMTDGYIGNEREIVEYVAKQMDENSRAFAFGVGSSVNRSFLSDFSKAGKGHTEFVTLDEQPDSAVARFHNKIRRPILTGITFAWKGVEATAVLPDPVPDLFDGDGLVVTGKYARAGSGTLTIKGKVSGRTVSMDVPVDFRKSQSRPEIGSLWARARIAQLQGSGEEYLSPDSVESLTQVALRYRLMSRYTSFVAVDEQVVNKGGKQEKVDVPVPLPDGVTESALGGGADHLITTSPSEGGSSETRSMVWPPSSPSSVMRSSTMDKVETSSDGLIGEASDPSEANMIDVILAGGGGRMETNGRGGRGTGGDGDRSAGIGGMGGRMMSPSKRSGEVRLGNKGEPSAKPMVRGNIAPPRPTDVELGGEAGSRSPESILRVIRQHIGGFRYTYEKFLRDNPKLGGKITLKFTIAPSGDIIAINLVSSNTGSAKLDEEIRDKAKRMKFDQIEKGNVTVTYTFTLDKQ